MCATATACPHVGDGCGGSVRVARCRMAPTCELANFADAKLAAHERERAGQRVTQAKIGRTIALEIREQALGTAHGPDDQLTSV